MDWSDDVAYSVHDVEDGVASLRLDLRALRSPSETEPLVAMACKLYAADLDEAELAEALERLLATGWIPRSYNGSRTDLAALKDMTSLLIGRFVQTVVAATRVTYGDGPLTRYAADLVIPDSVRAECAVLKGAAAYFVMYTDERQSLMGGQRTQIHELVEAYLAQPQTRLDPLHAGDYLDAADDGAACGWSSTRWPRCQTPEPRCCTRPGAERCDGAGNKGRHSTDRRATRAYA